MLVLRRFVFCATLFFTLTGFHGCLNEKVHKQTHPSVDGKLLRFVDTRAGTGGVHWIAGHNTPAVQVPWGMVKLGPDTMTLGKTMGLAGYHYGDVQISGFSHTRFVGAGVYGGGVLPVLPANSAMEYASLKTYRPTFSHRNETAIPGYYSVKLNKTGIQAELTTTARVGLHRYTFANSTSPVLYIDLAGMLAPTGANTELTVTVSGTGDKITGSFLQSDGFSSRYQGLRHFFEIQFPTTFASARFITAQGTSSTLPSGNHRPLYLELTFQSASPIEMRTALSFVNAAGAASNFTLEAPLAQSFDTLQAANQTLWEAWLGRIAVTTTNEADQQKFYTALYNSARMPTLFGDRNAGFNEPYHGFDGADHVTTGFSYYSDFSLWDTFRTVHPLYNLIARTEQLAMIQSMLRMAQESGRFPRWAAGGGHADSMLGFPAAITLSESYQKGITGFSAAAAYTLLKQQATPGSGLAGTECFDSYAQEGYCPSEATGTTVSYTLEYSWADAALARFATALGFTSDAAAFSERSHNFENLFSPGYQAFIPKTKAGEFFSDCRLNELSYIAFRDCAKHYTEGSALQHRWALPAQAEEVLALYSADPLAELETFFTESAPSIAAPVPTGYYWHGNEPDLFAVTYFNHLGRPDRTQYWTDWIRRTKYDTTSIGLDGNDDGGTLSAWYVLSGLGFLPIPGTTTYEIVSPLFETASVNLGGSTLVVQSTGATQGKIYVKGATLNGSRLPEPRFEHSAITTGGTLVLEMVETATAWQP